VKTFLDRGEARVGSRSCRRSPHLSSSQADVFLLNHLISSKHHKPEVGDQPKTGGGAKEDRHSAIVGYGDHEGDDEGHVGDDGTSNEHQPGEDQHVLGGRDASQEEDAGEDINNIKRQESRKKHFAKKGHFWDLGT